MKLVRAISCAFHMARAEAHASRAEYGLAMQHVRSCYALCHAAAVPSSEVPITVNLLTAFLALRLGQNETAVMCSSHVVAELRAGRGKLTPAERAHLDRYARMVGNRAAYLGASAPPWSSDSATGPLPEGKVRQAIKAAFPLKLAET